MGVMGATTMDRLWADYQQQHRTRGNRICHMIGIPMIVFGLLSLLSIRLMTVAGWPIELSLIILLVVGAVDIALDARLGALMLVSCFLLYLVGRSLRDAAWTIPAGLFVIGWVCQYVGHGVYERRQPAFYKNLVHLLIGPLWVLDHVFHVRGPGTATSPARG
ncbi:MAG TPA: Mpo1-like protein [Terriglobia bacterium]|nr:Mpo1-like protein [Terriglobia bacterium]